MQSQKRCFEMESWTTDNVQKSVITVRKVSVCNALREHQYIELCYPNVKNS
jgi:hypothetical protein